MVRRKRAWFSKAEYSRLDEIEVTYRLVDFDVLVEEAFLSKPCAMFEVM